MEQVSYQTWHIAGNALCKSLSESVHQSPGTASKIKYRLLANNQPRSVSISKAIGAEAARERKQHRLIPALQYHYLLGYESFINNCPRYNSEVESM